MAHDLNRELHKLLGAGAEVQRFAAAAADRQRQGYGLESVERNLTTAGEALTTATEAYAACLKLIEAEKAPESPAEPAEAPKQEEATPEPKAEEKAPEAPEEPKKKAKRKASKKKASKKA